MAKTAPPNSRRWVKKRVVATQLGVTVATVDNWLARDPLFPRPALFGNGAWRFDLDEIDAYVAARKRARRQAGAPSEGAAA
jgi:predicted DNA-binding transcriptional regulator AlpA